MKLLKDIWGFSLNPQLNSLNHSFVSLGGFFKVLLLCYVFNFILAIPSIILIKLIERIYSINLNEIRNQNFQNLNHGYYLFIIMAILAPLLEEVLFRLWLSLKKSHILLSLILLMWILITKFQGVIIYNQQIDSKFFQNLFLAVLTGVFVFVIGSFLPIKKLNFDYFKVLYWISCICFGLVHIFNFSPFKMNILWVYPFLIFSQLFAGFLLGYLRLKKGFFVGFALHCSINLFPALVYLLKK